MRPGRIQTGLLADEPTTPSASSATTATHSSATFLAWRALAAGLGLFVVSVADYRARRGLEPSEPLFWLGLLILVLPIALALWSPGPTRLERLGLVLLLGLGLYAVRVLYSPGAFVFFDEFSHWRTALDIGSTGTLLSANPLQPISPMYPGLEALTAMFASLSGLPISIAGPLVIGIARAVLVVGLFILFERASGSSRVAGLGVLIYAANPSFLFFDAQFAYESFAVALAAVALVALTSRTRDAAPTARSLTLLAEVAIAATVMTHHITSYALVAFLTLWVVVGLVFRRSAPAEARPLAAAMFGIVAIAGWLALVAPTTVDYLAPHLQDAAQQLVSLVTGSSSGRPLFQDATGVQASLIERVVAYSAVVLTLAALVLGFWTMLRSRRGRPLAIALGLVALAYPVSLVLRLTPGGAESAARASAFVYVGIAFVIATWGVTLGVPHMAATWRRLAAAVSVVVFSGGVMAGSPPWARLPYPYRPAADSRSIEPQSIDAAQWALSHVGAGHLFVSDRTNRQLLGTYGREDAFIHDAAKILLSTQLGPARRLIVSLHVDYVLVDRRLSDAVPLVSSYVSLGEHGGIRFTTPLDPAALEKFDSLVGADRVFDSGEIQIYDVRGVR